MWIRALCLAVVTSVGVGAEAQPPRAPDHQVWKWAPNVPQTELTRHMERLVGQTVGKRIDRFVARHPQIGRERVISRFARYLLYRQGKANPGVLPAKMPLLPAPRAGDPQKILDRAKRPGRPPRDLYLYAERQASLLRGSSSGHDQALGAQLDGYLARYKKQGWVDGWLDKRLSLFAGNRQSQRLRRSQRPLLKLDTNGINWKAVRPIASPAAASLKPIFDRCVAAHPQTDKLMASLERELFDLERTVAAGQQEKRGLRDEMADYMRFVRGKLTQTNVPTHVRPLPATTAGEAVVQTLIDQRRVSTKTPRELYLALASTAHMLTQSGDARERQLGGQLDGYLHRARKTFYPGSELRTVRQQVDQAWGIVTRAVHPELLGRVKRLKFIYGVRHDGAGHIKGGIYITPKTTPADTLKDVLHEIAHQIEKDGGLRVRARAYNIITQRANGRPSTGLSNLISNTSYSDSQRAYPGKVPQPYLLRRYLDGTTETYPLVMERLGDRRALKELLHKDGGHLLMVLSALQSP